MREHRGGVWIGSITRAPPRAFTAPIADGRDYRGQVAYVRGEPVTLPRTRSAGAKAREALPTAVMVSDPGTAEAVTVTETAKVPLVLVDPGGRLKDTPLGPSAAR